MAEPLDELLRRSPEERAHAALRLIESLDEGAAEADAAAAQTEELERRMRAIESGSAEIIKGDEVRRDGVALLRALRDE
jgi:hypothetical protein